MCGVLFIWPLLVGLFCNFETDT